jgi:hypothetical protein
MNSHSMATGILSLTPRRQYEVETSAKIPPETQKVLPTPPIFVEQSPSPAEYSRGACSTKFSQRAQIVMRLSFFFR